MLKGQYKETFQHKNICFERLNNKYKLASIWQMN